MEKELKNFIEESKKVKLSDLEKASGKSTVMDFVKNTPVVPTNTTPTFSPPAFIFATAGVAGLVAIVVLVGGFDSGVPTTIDVTEKGTEESMLMLDSSGPEDSIQSSLVAEEPVEDKNELMGTDSNNDGIRDDIETFINSSYPAEPAKREALKQYAGVLSRILEASKDPQKSLQVAEMNSRAISCLFYIDDGSGDLIDLSDDLFANFFNTKARSDAYVEYDRNLGEKVFDGFPMNKEACDFDVDSLMNDGEDVGEVSKESEITGPYGPASNQ